MVEVVHGQPATVTAARTATIYGKKRLREIDRRIRFLTRRLDVAEEVADPSAHHGNDQVSSAPR